MPELKPCPFCGSEVKKIMVFDWMVFSCSECGADVSFHNKKSDRDECEAWNRRAENEGFKTD